MTDAGASPYGSRGSCPPIKMPTARYCDDGVRPQPLRCGLLAYRREVVSSDGHPARRAPSVGDGLASWD